MHDATLFARCVLAAAFFASGALKLRAPAAFDVAVQALGRVPGRWVRPAGLGSIGAELAAGVLLLIPGTERFGFALAAALLIGFTALLARALRAAQASGEQISCACFGAGSAPISPIHLARNAILLALAAAGLALSVTGSAAARSWSLTGAGPAAVAALGLLLALIVVLLDDLVFLFGPAW